MSNTTESERKVWTVSQVNAWAKQTLEGRVPFWLEGEISNLTIHRSGHLYFSIKDLNSQISVVYFDGEAQAKKLNLKNGDQVNLFGSLSLYIPQGRYQFITQHIELQGEGLWKKRFEELKAKLLKEGLFSQEYKKKIPSLPRKIALITSKNGAAIKDFLSIIDRRFPKIHIQVYDIAVQGKNSAPEAIQAIKYFNKELVDPCDVIVLTRGGGSAEDLDAFNNEELARTIFASQIPLISAIGHEIDFTICDFVADLRCPTPSSAAELIIEKKDIFEEHLKILKDKTLKLMKMKVSIARETLKNLAKQQQLLSPSKRLNDQRQYLDRIYNSLFASLKAHLAREFENLGQKKDSMKIFYYFFKEKREQVKNLKQSLKFLNPYEVLSRGYSLARNKEGHIITSKEEAEKNKVFDLLLKDKSIIEVNFNKEIKKG